MSAESSTLKHRIGRWLNARLRGFEPGDPPIQALGQGPWHSAPVSPYLPLMYQDSDENLGSRLTVLDFLYRTLNIPVPPSDLVTSPEGIEALKQSRQEGNLSPLLDLLSECLLA